MSLCIVPVGRLASQHDFKSQETCSLKVDLFSTGGQVLKFLKQIHISNNQGQSWHPVSLISDPKPLGGSWGHQTRVVLEFSKKEPLIAEYLQARDLVFWVGVDRSLLKSELKDGEILVWDYLGAEVKEKSRPQLSARVVELLDPYENLRHEALRKGQKLPPVTLVVRYESGNHVEVPSTWIEEFDAEKKVLWFDNLSDWENLNNE